MKYVHFQARNYLSKHYKCKIHHSKEKRKRLRKIHHRSSLEYNIASVIHTDGKRFKRHNDMQYKRVITRLRRERLCPRSTLAVASILVAVLAKTRYLFQQLKLECSLLKSIIYISS